MEPENQGQHRLGIVYLKQFAFEFKGKRKICVWKKGEDYTSMKSVKSFSKENNIFDLPPMEGTDIRLFEKVNGQLETHYPKIIEDIEIRGKLGDNSESILVQFVANMLCRTQRFRNTIEDLYTDPATKEKFLKELG